MPDATLSSTLEEAKLRDAIDDLLGAIDGDSDLAKALKSLIIAIDYNDAVLLRSRLSNVWEEVCTVINEQIAQSSSIRHTLRQKLLPNLWRALEDCPQEALQRIGKLLNDRFDSMLDDRMRLRDELIPKLRKLEYPIDNADALDGVIEEIKAVRDEVLGNWPWDDRPLPAVNWKMVAESRAALDRGEGMTKEELFRQLNAEDSAN